jgi:hypothetical protein
MSLSMALILPIIGCDGKSDSAQEEEDTEETEETEEEEEEDDEPDYLEMTGLLVNWTAAIKDGQITTDVDANYGNYFYVYMTSDYWDGTNSDTEACIAYVETSNMEYDLVTYADAGASYGGWSVPAGSSYATSAGCKLVDPSNQFGSDPAGYFIQNYAWGFGLGPDTGKWTDSLSSYYDAWFEGFIYHQVTGTDTISEFNYVVVYEMNEKGGVDTNTLVDLTSMSKGDPLPDGWYYGGTYYGFTLN